MKPRKDQIKVKARKFRVWQYVKARKELGLSLPTVMQVVDELGYTKKQVARVRLLRPDWFSDGMYDRENKYSMTDVVSYMRRR
jgi:hypothetical protein